MKILNIILFISYFVNLHSLQFTKKMLKMNIDDENINYIKKYKNIIDKKSTIELFNDINNINSNKIDKIYISPNNLEVFEVDKLDIAEIENYHVIKTNPIIISKLIDKSIEKNIDTVFIDKEQNYLTEFNSFISQGFILFNNIFIPFLLVIFIRNILFSVFNNSNNMNSNMPFNIFNNMNNINKDKITMQKLNISLASWTGSEEIFEECTEVVSYLKNNTIYKNIGAELPKGILLEGPPGTGKTLLAKAIASECDANFISSTASEFIELYVGMGASRIRSLFKEARDYKPCIIFIDEIDAIGKQRSANINFGNDEREQTLNQLLAEMDGFNDNDGILIIAATNRKDILDKALLRAGRFDRIIKVPLPDRNSRKKILELYLNKKKIEDINIDNLSDITGGYSGADLKNIVNEAAIIAARKGLSVIRKNDIYESLEKSVVGLIKKKDNRSLQTKERISVHECGHGFLAAFYNEYFNLQKISIQSTFGGAGGYTIFTEKSEISEGGLYTRDLLKKKLTIILGGKAAEYIYYGEEQMSAGAIQDLKQANLLAQRMIGMFGMGDDLEVFYNLKLENNPSSTLNQYSDNTNLKFDQEVLNLLVESYNEAKLILEKNKNIFLSLIQNLSEKNILYNNDVIDIICNNNLEFNIENNL